jgi:hypothetical protein
MEVRIIHRYNPFAGTWYVVQKKILFWWKDFPLVFHEKHMAEQFVEHQFFKEKPCADKVEKTYIIEDGKIIGNCPHPCNHLNEKKECMYYTNWMECPIS